MIFFGVSDYMIVKGNGKMGVSFAIPGGSRQDRLLEPMSMSFATEERR
jgi:hypothetical protein